MVAMGMTFVIVMVCMLFVILMAFVVIMVFVLGLFMVVVIMFVFGMLVFMMIFAFGMFVVIMVMIFVFFVALGMLFITMILVVFMVFVILMVIVIMGLKQRAFAEVEKRGTIRLKEGGNRGIGRQSFNRIFHPRGQVFADPKHKVSVLQRRSLGRAQAVLMRGRTGLDDQGRRADPIHNPRDQRMDGRDINRDVRDIGKSGAAHQDGGH
jgi:hypothetical protein